MNPVDTETIPDKATRIRWIRTQIPNLDVAGKQSLQERSIASLREQRALIYKLLSVVRTEVGGTQYARELHPQAWAEVERLRRDVLMPHVYPVRTATAVTGAAWAILYENVIDTVLGRRARASLMGPVISVLGDEHYWGQPPTPTGR